MVPQAISTRESYYYCVDKNNITLSPAKIDTGLSPLDYSFYWTFNGNPIANTSKELDASQEGIYRVEATNLITGCEIHLTATVKKSSPATATATVGNDFDYVQTITVNTTSGISEYLYQLNEGPFQESNVFNIYLGGIYTITVKDKNGCNDFVFKVEAYSFPRFFTPNGDGYNDFWNITEIPNPATSTIFIFDKMGKFLKQISPTGEGWDGTFVGKPMPATDYWFVLKYEDVSGSQKEFKSHFALKR
jgi:gliding motility-associated-like protein